MRDQGPLRSGPLAQAAMRPLVIGLLSFLQNGATCLAAQVRLVPTAASGICDHELIYN